VLDVAQALTHPQLTARGSILAHHHPVAGFFQTVASPVRFDHQRPAAAPPAPRLGEHTREVLEGLLGLEPAAIDALFAAGVIAEPPTSSPP
jgi:crotonobetainyl-CoA:carnitine CoA-transferase CaiB-like acyl-CoA transferase